MTFIQVIEITTTHPEEIQVLVEEWSARTEGRRTAYRAAFTADRDRPGTYVQLVEFPSYEQAMANSSLPETGEFAEKLARLCDSPPTFRNLDVRRVDEFSLTSRCRLVRRDPRTQQLPGLDPPSSPARTGQAASSPAWHHRGKAALKSQV